MVNYGQKFVYLVIFITILLIALHHEIAPCTDPKLSHLNDHRGRMLTGSVVDIGRGGTSTAAGKNTKI